MKKIALISIIMVAIVFPACFAYAGEAAGYTVKPGDTLYEIGKKFGLHYSAIMKTNKLDSTVIMPGMRLALTDAGGAADHRVQPVLSGNASFGSNDILLLAKMIHAESRGGPLSGQIAEWTD